MHEYIINASIQVVPVAQDRHPYAWVDEAIELVKSSHLTYAVGPFATVVEGKYEEVMKLIDRINNHLQQKGCPEWITNVQIHIRSEGSITGEEKIGRHQ